MTNREFQEIAFNVIILDGSKQKTAGTVVTAHRLIQQYQNLEKKFKEEVIEPLSKNAEISEDDKKKEIESFWNQELGFQPSKIKVKSSLEEEKLSNKNFEGSFSILNIISFLDSKDLIELT